ncbi:MAG TPA: YciI family protein [Dehalococcoidia bacterium]|nr:YciI family protein [Dehalococcoidia bacterium]
MPQYMLMICYDPTAPPDPDMPPSRKSEHEALSAQLRDEGTLRGGGGLMPPEIVPPIRLRAGKTVDGPFAESKELLGGYYVVECKDAEEAKAIAARIPVNKNDWIEIRQQID